MLLLLPDSHTKRERGGLGWRRTAPQRNCHRRSQARGLASRGKQAPSRNSTSSSWVGKECRETRQSLDLREQKGFLLFLQLPLPAALPHSSPTHATSPSITSGTFVTGRCPEWIKLVPYKSSFEKHPCDPYSVSRRGWSGDAKRGAECSRHTDMASVY